MTAKEIIENNLFEVAAHYMDEEIREEIHQRLAPCSEKEFLEEYIKEHEKKYREEFIIN